LNKKKVEFYSRYQLVFAERTGNIQAGVMAGKAVYHHLSDILYKRDGIYVWMEESGVVSAVRNILIDFRAF
jgi:hypothetical protein